MCRQVLFRHHNMPRLTPRQAGRHLDSSATPRITPLTMSDGVQELCASRSPTEEVRLDTGCCPRSNMFGSPVGVATKPPGRSAMLGLPLGRTLAKLRGRQVEWEHRPQSRSRSRLGRRHLKEQPLEEEVDMGLVRHLKEQPLEEEVDMGLVGGPCAWQASSGLNPKASGVSTAGYSKADAEKEDLKGAQEEEVEVRRMKRVKLQLQEMIRAKPNRAASWPKARREREKKKKKKKSEG